MKNIGKTSDKSFLIEISENELLSFCGFDYATAEELKKFMANSNSYFSPHDVHSVFERAKAIVEAWNDCKSDVAKVSKAMIALNKAVDDSGIDKNTKKK